MRIHRRTVYVILSIAALLVAGCGISSTVAPAATATVPPTPMATSAPTMTPIPTADATTIKQCFGYSVDPMKIGQIGTLLFWSDVGYITYPLVQIPPGTPLKPYKLTGSLADSFAGSFVPGVKVDPTGKPNQIALHLDICNTTHQPVMLQAISVKLADFTPYTGELDTWTPPPCATTYYHNSPPKVDGIAGCGGAVRYDLGANVTFATMTPGTAVAVTLTGGQTHFPVHLSGTELVQIGGQIPNMPGFATFTVGVQIAGQAMTYAPVGGKYLYAPVTRSWDGQACTKSTMLAQIPSSPPADYLCPN